MKLAWCGLLPALAIGTAAMAQSPFYDPPAWEQNAGPSIYNTYGSETSEQPKMIIPKDKSLGSDSYGVPRRRDTQRTRPGKTYLDSVGKACGKQERADCN